SNEEGAVLTSDGLTLYVATNNPAVSSSSSFVIATATRTSTAADFGMLSSVAGINFSGTNTWPWITPDGKDLYFDPQRAAASGNFHIYHASRTTGPFGAATIVGELSSTASEFQPVLATDGLSIFFSSSRPGAKGPGGIWMATRSTISDGFGTPTLVS